MAIRQQWILLSALLVWVFCLRFMNRDEDCVRKDLSTDDWSPACQWVKRDRLWCGQAMFVMAEYKLEFSETFCKSTQLSKAVRSCKGES